MAPTAATTENFTTDNNTEMLSTLSDTFATANGTAYFATDDNINTTFSSLFPSDDFLYDSSNSTPSTYFMPQINGTAGVAATNYTSISDVDSGTIAVGGLEDIAMISSAEVMMNDGADELYRPSHLLRNARLHQDVQHVALPSNSSVKGGSDSNFMYLLEDLGEYFYNYNSTSNGVNSENSGYYFSGITSTGFPNSTDFDYRTQNCSNVTCIDPITGKGLQ